MDLEKIFREHLSTWMMELGHEGDVVLASRVRLARNLRGFLFPSIASEQELAPVLSAVEKVVAKTKYDLKLLRLAGLDHISRQELVEKHLISPEHARPSEGKGVALNPSGDVSIMVNEEDHLRIQVLRAGLALEEAYGLADQLDDEFEDELPYAYSSRKGYLTSCPTNVGTGLRASVMLHLPGVVLLGQFDQVASSCSKLGLVIRGLYGEGSASAGNIFQVSNQLTLGYSEEEIMNLLRSVSGQIIEQERKARRALWQNKQGQLEDQVFRAYGILAYARNLSSEEAMELLSRVKLGIDLGLVKGVDSVILKELMVVIRPAVLQKIVGNTADSEERDQKRAMVIRERLSQ